MRVISIKKLKEFWSCHPQSEKPLRAWYTDVKKAEWKTSMDIKKVYRNASFLKDNRVVFNIKGNDYRLIVLINYPAQIIYIRFVGTHEQYDQINAMTI